MIYCRHCPDTFTRAIDARAHASFYSHGVTRDVTRRADPRKDYGAIVANRQRRARERMIDHLCEFIGGGRDD